jgi:hypothetical protein
MGKKGRTIDRSSPRGMGALSTRMNAPSVQVLGSDLARRIGAITRPAATMAPAISNQPTPRAAQVDGQRQQHGPDRRPQHPARLEDGTRRCRPTGTADEHQREHQAGPTPPQRKRDQAAGR